MTRRHSLTALSILQGPYTTFLPDEETAFLVRVQLTNSTNSYDAFHDCMAEQGFSLTIPSMDGETKKLPDATYFISGLPDKTSPETVFNRVRKAVEKHKEQSDQMNIKEQIIVVKASDAWFDLANHVEKSD